MLQLVLVAPPMPLQLLMLLPALLPLLMQLLLPQTLLLDAQRTPGRWCRQGPDPPARAVLLCHPSLQNHLQQPIQGNAAEREPGTDEPTHSRTSR